MIAISSAFDLSCNIIHGTDFNPANRAALYLLSPLTISYCPSSLSADTTVNGCLTPCSLIVSDKDFILD